MLLSAGRPRDLNRILGEGYSLSLNSQEIADHEVGEKAESSGVSRGTETGRVRGNTVQTAETAP